MSETQADRFNALNRDLMQRRVEWEQWKTRLANTTHAQLREEVEAMVTELEQRRKTVEEMTVRKTKADAKIKKLKDQMINAKGQQEKEIKEAKAKIERCAKIAKEAAEKCGNKEFKLKELHGDIDLLAKEIEGMCMKV